MQVNNFAKLLGLPASKVRYYDQQGLIRGSRGENNYRHFSPQDALDIYHAQMLRSFDMSIQESLEAKASPLPMIDGWVAGHIADMEEAIRLQEMKLHRLREMKAYFQKVSSPLQLLPPMDRDKSYNVWNLGCAAPLSPAGLEVIRQLAAAMPFSYIAVRVSRESILRGGEDLEVSAGLGILERNRAKLGISIPPEIPPLDARPVLEYLIGTPNPFALKRRDLQPLLDEMEKQNISLKMDLIGRFYISYMKDGQFVHGLCLGLNLPE